MTIKQIQDNYSIPFAHPLPIPVMTEPGSMAMRDGVEEDSVSTSGTLYLLGSSLRFQSHGNMAGSLPRAIGF